MPGRKTDVADAVWIAQLVEHGLIRPSFVPPPLIRELRRKIPQLKQALTGRFTEAHALVLREVLRHIDCLEAAIQRTSKRVDEVISPFATERDLLTTIPGVDRRLAEAIIAEVGVDMAVFGNPRRGLAWPPTHVSRTARIGGQVEVRTARHGDTWLQRHLAIAAWQPRAPSRPTSPLNTRDSLSVEATAEPAKPSVTRSWWPASTSLPGSALHRARTGLLRTTQLTGTPRTATPPQPSSPRLDKHRHRPRSHLQTTTADSRRTLSIPGRRPASERGRSA